MTAELDVRHNSVDIDPDWYAGQPETAEEAQSGEVGAAPTITVPTVLTKLQKWGDYESWGEPVWPSQFIPMKTPLSQEILDNWQLSNPPKHRLTVNDILAAQAAADRHVGLILDLSNHDCLYITDVPPTVDYLHVQLVAKELPPLEFVQEVGRAANQHWRQHTDSYIAIHCAYGFNRTGFVVCSYLIEHCGLSVELALQSFARSRPPGVKHEKFKNELHARYGLSNMHVQRPVSSCGPICLQCGQASCSIPTSSSSTAVTATPMPSQLSATAAAADSQSGIAAVVEGCSSSSNSTAEEKRSSSGAPAAATRPACVLNVAAEQPATAELRRGSYSSSSSNSQKPPPPPQLAQLLTSSSSIDAYTLPRLPDNSSSPLPLISGRCYSSGSMGDNSSIGCSPTDSTADVLLTGGSSSHSSVSLGFGAGRSPLAAVRQQQQAAAAAASAASHYLGRRGGLQGGSSTSSHGRLSCSVPVIAASTAAAAAVGVGHGPQSSRSGLDLRVASNQCADADAFEIDPCGEERDDSSSSGWRCSDGVGATTNGWFSDGTSYQEQQQQQQQQEAFGSQQLSELMAAVRLGQQQQQQQHSEQYSSAGPGADCGQQQEALNGISAESTAAAAAAECGCSCHTVEFTVRRSSNDGGVWQTQLRYSAMSSADGRRPGGLHELVDNESFGRVTTADMLMGLRSLQEQKQQHSGS